MVDTNFKEQLLQALDRLSPEQQQQALDFVRNLAVPFMPGTPGEVLLAHMEDFHFEHGQLDEMEKAIEESCE
jgi:hypothetical protein